MSAEIMTDERLDQIEARVAGGWNVHPEEALLIAEVERLREETHFIYCPACGSCGDTGCCGEKKCLYLSDHHKAIADANKLLGDDWDAMYKIVPEADGIDRYDLVSKVQALVSSRDSHAAEVDRLRGVFEAAPHGDLFCSLMCLDGWDSNECNCWKSKAVAK